MTARFLISILATVLCCVATSANAQEKWNALAAKGGVVLTSLDDAQKSATIEKITIPATLRAEEIARFWDDGEPIEPQEGVEYQVVGARFNRPFPKCRTLVLPQNPPIVESLLVPAFDAFPALETFVVEEPPARLEKVVFQTIDGVLFAKVTTSYDMVTSYSKTPKPENILELVNFGRQFSLLKYPPGRDAEEYAVPEPTTFVAQNAFAQNKALKKVTFPQGLGTIGMSAFSECSSLAEINIPEKLFNVEPSAFWGCSSLAKEEFAFPKPILFVQEGAFGKTPIKRFVVPEDAPLLRSVDGVVFSKDMKRLVAYPSGNDAKEYAIPETVEIVAPLAFAGNPTLEKVACPGALKVVAQGAFKDCPALWSVSLPGDVEIAPDAFEGTRVRN